MAALRVWAGPAGPSRPSSLRYPRPRLYRAVFLIRSWRPVHPFKYLTAKPRLYRRERDLAHFSAFSELYSADKYRVARRFAGSAAARTEGDGLPSEAYTATLHRPHGAVRTMRRRAASFLHGTSDARPSRVDFCRRVDIFFLGVVSVLGSQVPTEQIRPFSHIFEAI